MSSPLPFEVIINGNHFLLQRLLGYGINGMSFFAYNIISKDEREEAVVKIFFPDVGRKKVEKVEKEKEVDNVRKYLIRQVGEKCFPNLLCFYDHCQLRLEKKEEADNYLRIYQLINSILQITDGIQVDCECNRYNLIEVGRPFEVFISNFVEGEDLEDMLLQRMKIGEPFEYEFLSSLARDIVSALIHLHQQAVAHGDIKPGNVFLRKINDREKSFILIDFSLSSADHLFLPFTSVSKKYIPKEFIFRPEKTFNELKERDLFSFGVMLYELYTLGEEPFIRDEEGDYDPSSYIPLSRRDSNQLTRLIDQLITNYKRLSTSSLRLQI